ncbi:MAG: flavodoxin family protein [Candidatus Eremiobacteraeota bacterium]|nr:flavodoxin family protein [Candidatus Eremiobacteraeota bacterium]
MKLLVVNGSPRGAHGNTELLVQRFIEGAKAAGAELMAPIYLKDKNIRHCIGCFTCWTRTPGVCVHKDDMQELLLKLREAEGVVLATPLYYFNITGLMKDFMDRTLPLCQPFFEVHGDRCMHPLRYSNGLERLVVISNCGFPEQAHFSGLKEVFRTLVRSDQIQLNGMICCAGGEKLQSKDDDDSIAWYLDAVKKAGTEVVKEGKISEETSALLERPLFEDSKAYALQTNEFWRSLGLEPCKKDAKPTPA